MLKLVILLSFVTVLYGYDWADDDYVTGVVGSWVKVDGCQAKFQGKCSSSTPCCRPFVCWMDGACREKVPEYLSIDGLEYVTGKAMQYHRYDGCNNNRKRTGESCKRTNDCCFPLDCRGWGDSAVCSSNPNVDYVAALFSAGWGIPLPVRF